MRFESLEESLNRQPCSQLELSESCMHLSPHSLIPNGLIVLVPKFPDSEIDYLADNTPYADTY